jgi:drug/metabolite transporter (DMT)-like permease
MSPAWIPFITVTILLFGTGQVFTKEGTTRLGSSGMLFLLSVNMFIIYGGAYLLFHEDTPVHPAEIISCMVAVILSAVGYIFYYESVERQKISIVGVITAAYPFVTVVLAGIFLHEPLTLLQGAAVAIIILSVSVLSYIPGEQNPHNTSWLRFAVLCFVTWGIWAAAAKCAIDLAGHITYTGVYAVVGPLIWIPYWYVRSGTFCITRRDFQAELSVAFFCIGGLTFYAALNYGLASIVTAFSNLYPFVTLVLARIMLSEALETHHTVAVVLALSGILLLSI